MGGQRRLGRCRDAYLKGRNCPPLARRPPATADPFVGRRSRLPQAVDTLYVGVAMAFTIAGKQIVVKTIILELAQGS